MATFLDIGLTSYFGSIFVMLFVFVLLFAILQKSSILGKNKGLHGIMAFCISVMTLFVPGVVTIIGVMTPWFVLLFILFAIFMVILNFMGVSESKITSYMSHDWQVVHWFLFVIALIVFIGAIGTVYGGSLLPYSGANAENASLQLSDGSMKNADGGLTGQTTNTGDFNQNVGRVIFHPKTIGLVFVLIVASLTIRLLCGVQK